MILQVKVASFTAVKLRSSSNSSRLHAVIFAVFSLGCLLSYALSTGLNMA